MTSLSRIARLARIPEIRKKKRETDPRKKKHSEDTDQFDESGENPPVFPLKEDPEYKKLPTSPKPRIKTQPRPSIKSTSTSESDIVVGKRLDLKV